MSKIEGNTTRLRKDWGKWKGMARRVRKSGKGWTGWGWVRVKDGVAQDRGRRRGREREKVKEASRDGPGTG